jgi:hypothetical protein
MAPTVAFSTTLIATNRQPLPRVPERNIKHSAWLHLAASAVDSFGNVPKVIFDAFRMLH